MFVTICFWLGVRQISLSVCQLSCCYLPYSFLISCLILALEIDLVLFWVAWFLCRLGKRVGKRLRGEGKNAVLELNS